MDNNPNKFSRPIVIALWLAMLSCTTKTDSPPTQSPDSTQAEHSISPEIPQDSLTTYDTTNFPAEQRYTLKILSVGMFHSDEVWNSASKENWIGLFKSQSGYYLASTQINTKRVNDVVVDNDNEVTGWEVSTSNKDSCLLLIPDVPYITAHNPVKTVELPSMLYPGDTSNFSLEGVTYQLYATGDKKSAANSLEVIVGNYKLFLSTKKESETVTQLLVARPTLDGQMIEIIFAGDIDGDGLVDFIIDTSRHYNVTAPTLYLSRPSSEHELLQVVGMHVSVGC